MSDAVEKEIVQNIVGADETNADAAKKGKKPKPNNKKASEYI